MKVALHVTLALWPGSLVFLLLWPHSTPTRIFHDNDIVGIHADTWSLV